MTVVSKEIEELSKKAYQSAYEDGYGSAAESSLWGLISYVTDELTVAQIESLQKKVHLKFTLVLDERNRG